MAKLDLSDFVILKEIYRTRSVTGSVPEVGLSQPAISVRLSHMREHFCDPLFVKTPQGMMPTPLMESLISAIDQTLDLLGPNRGGFVPFMPETASRTFRLGLSHVAQLVVLPALLPLFEAAGTQLKVDSMDLDDTTGQAMTQGQVDVAIGFTVELNTGFFQQRLFTEHYACIVRKGHPRLDTQLTTEQFLREEHVSLVAPGTGHSRLDKQLRASGIARNIKLRVSSFLGLEQIIIATDLLAVVPARLAGTLALGGRITALKIPFPTPDYEVRQYWHERYHRDPANAWLRQLIFRTFVNLPPVQPD